MLVTITHAHYPRPKRSFHSPPAGPIRWHMKGAYASAFLDTRFMLPFAAPHDFQCPINRE